MSAIRNPAGNEADLEDADDGQVPPIPDEDGPHDVPDEQVIEKTLPTGPVPGITSSDPS